MSTPLLGYMMRGPLQLLPAHRTALDRRLLVLRTAVREVLTTKSESSSEHLWRLLAPPVDYGDDGPRRMASITMERSEQDELLEIQELAEKEDLIDDIFAVWNTYDAHDLSFRVFGDKKVMFAGEMSCGDEPEGRAYQTLKAIDRLNLGPLLGIE